MSKLRKNSILNELFNARADVLSERPITNSLDNIQKFLDTVSNLDNENLKQRIINVFMACEDDFGSYCGDSNKCYYESRI